MSESYVQLPTDGVGKKLRAIQTSGTVYNEVLIIGRESGVLVDEDSRFPVSVGSGVILNKGIISGVSVIIQADAVVKISGEMLWSGLFAELPDTQIVKVSGETLLVKASGEWYEVHMLSGDISSNISGQWLEVHMLSGDIASNVSGQWLEVHMLSGDITSNISGQYITAASALVTIQGTPIVKISGETIVLASGGYAIISGQGAFLPDTQVIKISGEQIVVASGLVTIQDNAVVKVSGDTIVLASGGHVIASGAGVLISGQTISLTSGTEVLLESGQNVMISGQGVMLPDTQVVKISGDTVVVASGTYIDGIVDIDVPVLVKTGGMLLLDDNSGGVVIGSGAVKSVVLKAKNDNSGIVFIGGSGAEMPYSGRGLMLEAGDGVNLDVSNFDAVYAMSSISGYATLSFAGVQ